jgi:hypothetical protein
VRSTRSTQREKGNWSLCVEERRRNHVLVLLNLLRERVIRGKFGRSFPCMAHLNYCAQKYTPYAFGWREYVSGDTSLICV